MRHLLSVLVGGLVLLTGLLVAEAQTTGDFSAGCQLLTPTQGICQSGFGPLAPGISTTVHFSGPFCFPPLITARVSTGPLAESPAAENVYAALGRVTPEGIGVVVTNGDRSSTSGGFVGIHWVCP